MKKVEIGSLWLREHDQRRFWICSRVTKINNTMYNVTLLSMSEDLQITIPIYHLLQAFKCIGKCKQV
jgi:hypothetical protein